MRRTAIAALSLCLLTACGANAKSGHAGAKSSRTTEPSEPPTTTTQSTAPAPPSCVDQTAAGLTTRQKAAQLILVALARGGNGATAQIAAGNASGVFLLGGWPSAEAAASASASVHALADPATGIGTWVAIDQEGGVVQQLSGPGIADIPTAVEQAGIGDLAGAATTWAVELKQAGIDINLAPVADVVPADIGAKNAPIGQYSRQYGATPEAVTAPMLAFMQGMQAGGITPTIKHFPGIGRITGNTDVTTSGITDDQANANDPALAPFKAAIDAGAPIVMVSTARYPALDPNNQATFSAAIVTTLLREQLGFAGVAMTDDVGAAESVADTPVAERATRFIAAGGDVVLTAEPAQAGTMTDALVALYEGDPAFAAKLDASVRRVLTLKDQQKLLPCSSV